MANALLIWDNNKSYVENELSFELDIFYPDDCVFSFEELKKNNVISAKSAIIVLLDTNIDGHWRSSLYGIEIIKYLRKEVRYKGLIIAYSTYSEEQILKKIGGSGILVTSGIRLRKITQKGIDTEGIDDEIQAFADKKISDDLLDDIIFSKIDAKGKIHELLHNLKNSISDIKGKNNLEDFIGETNTVFEEYKKLLLKEIDPFKITEFEKFNAILIQETVEDIANHWDKEKNKNCFSYANAGNLVNKFSNQIMELAPVSNDDVETQQAENIKWQVLFFDDTEGIRKKVKAFFEEKNVTCHLASTEEEVYQKLKENSPNISLFISDIRLLDKNEHWCDRQGYDVIEQVNTMKNYDYPLVYAVLTSKKGTINKMVQKKRKYEILWFSKDDVINNIHSFNVFFDLIKEYADENFKSNTIFQPIYSTWNKPYGGQYTQPLKAFYKLHRESHDYQSEESNINKKTLEWLDVVGAKQDWMCKLQPKGLIGNSDLRKFRDTKLLGRRVALALVASGQMTKAITVYNFMTGNDKKSGDESIKQLYFKLALSSTLEETITDAENYFKGKGKEKKLGILYEEYKFLKNEFFEEQFTDSINLGYEKDEFYAFIEQIQKAFDANNILEPNKSFERVKIILEKKGSPKVERLDTMFAELKELDKQTNHKLLKEIKKHSFLSTVNNGFLKGLLTKYDLR